MVQKVTPILIQDPDPKKELQRFFSAKLFLPSLNHHKQVEISSSLEIFESIFLTFDIHSGYFLMDTKYIGMKQCSQETWENTVNTDSVFFPKFHPTIQVSPAPIIWNS